MANLARGDPNVASPGIVQVAWLSERTRLQISALPMRLIGNFSGQRG
jgi:hypothetical protein